MNAPTEFEISEGSPFIYKLLVDSVSDYAIFLLDPDGYVRTWNTGAERTKQYTKEEIIGQHFSTFYTEADQAAGLPAKLMELALKEGRVEDEGWRVRKDGTRFWADVVLTALYDETGALCGFAKVTRDLTERRHLVREREEAMQASSAKSAFLANMSHELRTPLTAIIGYAEMLDEDQAEIDVDTLRDHLAKIMFSGRHLLSIVSDILDLSKIEAGSLQLQYSEVDPREVLQEVIDTIQPLSACNNNTIIANVEDDIPIIEADRLRLRQILYNLFSNAVKFTHDGTITARVKRSTVGDVPALCMEVTDTGIGMTQDEAEQVFDRFRQVDAHVNSFNQGGTGLGLAICRMLTDSMGGAISVVSEPGKGSTFTVLVPIQREHEAK